MSDGNAILYDLDDLKLRKLLADPVGGSPAWDPYFDVPSVQSCSCQATVKTKNLPGDATIRDIFTKVTGLNGSVRSGEISIDMLAVLLGGDKLTELSGARTRYKHKGAHLPNFFGLEGQVRYKGGSDVALGGDFHLVAYKCKITNFSIEFQNEEYALVSFDWQAIPLRSNDDLFDLVDNDTEDPIPTSADTTAPSVSSATPADEAASVAVNTTIVWNFDEAIQKNPDAFRLYTSGAGSELSRVAGAVTFNAGGTQATLTPSSALANSTTYVRHAAGVRDLAGNVMADHFGDFTTIA